MKDFLRIFASAKDGAVTVDWVVLTAAIVGLAFAVTVVVREGATAPAESIGKVLSAEDVSTQ